MCKGRLSGVCPPGRTVSAAVNRPGEAQQKAAGRLIITESALLLNQVAGFVRGGARGEQSDGERAKLLAYWQRQSPAEDACHSCNISAA